MNFKMKPETHELFKAFSLAGMVIVLFYVVISNLNIIGGAISSIVSALSPFIFGCVMAFILIPLRNLLEQKVMRKKQWKQSTKRKISVAVTMIAMILFLIGFFWLLIPQVISSITTFVSNIRTYISNIQEFLDSFAQMSGQNQEIVDTIMSKLTEIGNDLAQWLTGASGGLTKIVGYVSDVVSVITNFLIGMIIAVYLLLDSERFKLQIKKLTYSILPLSKADRFISIGRLTSDMFYKYISGNALDSLMVGIICYIGCTILGIPYAVLIAIVIAITNMIPVFGPFLGAIPCLIILVMIDWVKALEFLIFILVLQQIDGNIVAPYILGDAVGLPTLWVMFAIIVGGSLFGVVGMFIGVPSFAVIYTLAKEWIEKKLKDKNIQLEETNTE